MALPLPYIVPPPPGDPWLHPVPLPGAGPPDHGGARPAHQLLRGRHQDPRHRGQGRQCSGAPPQVLAEHLGTVSCSLSSPPSLSGDVYFLLHKSVQQTPCPPGTCLTSSWGPPAGWPSTSGRATSTSPPPSRSSLWTKLTSSSPSALRPISDSLSPSCQQFSRFGPCLAQCSPIHDFS